MAAIRSLWINPKIERFFFVELVHNPEKFHKNFMTISRVTLFTDKQTDRL